MKHLQPWRKMIHSLVMTFSRQLIRKNPWLPNSKILLNTVSPFGLIPWILRLHKRPSREGRYMNWLRPSISIIVIVIFLLLDYGNFYFWRLQICEWLSHSSNPCLLSLHLVSSPHPLLCSWLVRLIQYSLTCYRNINFIWKLPKIILLLF